jgi:hypothetical protein
VRYVTAGGTYQLTDAGGWRRVGGGYIDGSFTPFRYRGRERDISPLLGASWSPGQWDLNGSYKGTLTLAKTHTIPYVTNPLAQGATSRTYGRHRRQRLHLVRQSELHPQYADRRRQQAAVPSSLSYR